MRDINCTKCKKIFSTRRRLHAHLKSCHYISCNCAKCGKSFLSQKYLWRHTKEVHGDCSFNCLKCPMSFKNEKALKRHLPSCTTSCNCLPPFATSCRSFNCEVCMASFTRRHRLAKHYRKHQEQQGLWVPELLSPQTLVAHKGRLSLQQVRQSLPHYQ